jgi:hypothetical protein
MPIYFNNIIIIIIIIIAIFARKLKTTNLSGPDLSFTGEW